MNPLFREAAGYVHGGWLMGVMTALFLGCFIGWAAWAYAKGNRRRFEDAALLPFTTGDDA
jgi:cytochrome c oxidase cbb3-type subunit IV